MFFSPLTSPVTDWYDSAMQVSPTSKGQSPNTQTEYQRRLTPKGGVTLPVEIRRMLGVEPRGEVRFRIHDDIVELLPPAMTFEETFGSVKVGKQPLDFKKVREIAIEDHVQKVVHKMRR